MGGQTADGLDATNELSYMAIEASAHVRLFSAVILDTRLEQNNRMPFCCGPAELARLGLGVPAYYNDEVIIAALTSRGLTIQDAREYGVIGCVEPQRPGKTEGWHDSAVL